jgi:DNA-binding IclR family transcriptional regulator
MTEKQSTPETAKSQRGIQTLDSSGQLLEAVAQARQPLSLKELSQAAGLNPAKAFPHLVSLLKTGMLSRDAAGNFAPGSLALQLSLIALQRLSPAREAELEIQQLAEETEMSVVMAVLGPLGPCVVRLEEASRPQHINLRLGTVMSLVHTAIGRVFAAHLTSDVLQQQLAHDNLRLAGQPGTPGSDYYLRLHGIATAGIDSALDVPVPGIHTLAAPVFDHSGSICLVISLIGAAGSFDPDHQGSTARLLLRTTSKLSHRLGFVQALHGQQA